MPHDWRATLIRGAGLLLLIAGVARLAYELLVPLVPAVVTIICLAGIYTFVARRFFGRW